MELRTPKPRPGFVYPGPETSGGLTLTDSSHMRCGTCGTAQPYRVEVRQGFGSCHSCGVQWEFPDAAFLLDDATGQMVCSHCRHELLDQGHPAPRLGRRCIRCGAQFVREGRLPHRA